MMTGIAGSGDAERLSTFALPISAHGHSPEFQGTSPGPSGSFYPALADAENSSVGTGAPNSSTLLERSNGHCKEFTIASSAEQCVSDIAETSMNSQLLSTVLPLSPGTSHGHSLEVQMGPFPLVLADAGNRSVSTGAPILSTLLEHQGHKEASTIARLDEQGVSDTSRKPMPSSPNKFELRVFPDNHSIVNDSLLRCTPYIVNVKYKVLICTDCKYSIIRDCALEHLRQKHPHCKVEATFPAHLDKRFPGLISEAIHPPETIEAVFGLEIPVNKYTICSQCRRGYVDVPSWRRHICRTADTTPVAQHPHFRSYVQTFFRGKKICYVPVDVPDSPSGGTNGNDFDLFKTNFQELGVSDGEIHEPDYRELNQFLQKEGWINHVSGFSPSELSHLTGLTNNGQDLKCISRDVAALMSKIQTTIGTAGYHVRRLLGKRPA